MSVGAINVVVSKVGESKKALIFQFFPPDDNEIPTIRSIGYGTVQISMPSVPNLGQGIRCERIIFRGLQMGENGLR
jgi:hypothetical protein